MVNLKQLRRIIHAHWQAVAIFMILTVVVTFPMILYVFRTDVFWLPTGNSRDIYMSLWDMWYGNLVLTGQAERFFTDVMFFPEGVSLAAHPLFLLQAAVVNAVMSVLPLSNSFNLSYLIMIFFTALCGYVYTLYVFKSKWLALFGAAVLSFGPHVLSHYNHPPFLFVASIPLCLYFFHRGVNEKRWTFIVAAGLMVGATTEINLYLYVCLLMTLGLFIIALAATRWRDGRFWRLVALLTIAVSVSSAWRLYPLVSESTGLSETLAGSGATGSSIDLLSFIINSKNGFTAPLFESIVQPDSKVVIRPAAYLGIIPLALIGFGLRRKHTRQKMLPWLVLLLIFLVISLGSTLVVNGVRYPQIPTPRALLNQLMPMVFRPFYESDHFIMGMILPLAISATYGLQALQQSRPSTRSPIFVLLLIGGVALEYYVPIEANVIENEQFTFLEWLSTEGNASEIRLINTPMGRFQAKRYNLYQALSGYPSAEGAISRPPEAAFDYIHANKILDAWRDDVPARCDFSNEAEYLTALGQLEADGFSHVVYHRGIRDAEMISESFTDLDPAYADDYVSIYRVIDLKDYCPRNFIRKKMTQAHAAATLLQPLLNERHGTVVSFQGDLPADEQDLRVISQAMFDQKDLVSISVAENDDLLILSSNENFRDLDAIATVNDALWLVNNPLVTDLREQDVYANWFTTEYKFCRRYLELESGTIDLYLKPDIPCEPVAITGGDEVLYDNGIRLLNFAYALEDSHISFTLSWQKPVEETYSFSIQIMDAQGERTLQFDSIMQRQPVSFQRLDHDLPSDREFTVKLVVYDFHTGKSQGGIVQRTMNRFERELEIARIET